MSAPCERAARRGPRTAGSSDSASYRGLLTLARELWVLRDRQRVLEALLEARGILVSDEIDRFEWPASAEAECDRECRAFVDALVADLGVPPNPR